MTPRPLQVVLVTMGILLLADEDRMKPHLQYWQDTLGVDLPVLELQPDHLRPAVLCEPIPLSRLQDHRSLQRLEGKPLLIHT